MEMLSVFKLTHSSLCIRWLERSQLSGAIVATYCGVVLSTKGLQDVDLGLNATDDEITIHVVESRSIAGMGNKINACGVNKAQLAFEVTEKIADVADEWLGKGVRDAKTIHIPLGTKSLPPIVSFRADLANL
eukprot:3555804-Amphidinium_carterae.1